MIEAIVQPQTLDNDVAVIKILQLMGQLSPNDIKYVFSVASKVHNVVANVPAE